MGNWFRVDVDAEEITCPRCGHITALIDDNGDTRAWHDLAVTVNACADTGSGEHQCPNCGQPCGRALVADRERCRR
jgi:hypothetical protein